MKQKQLIVTITGQTCAGKSTLEKLLVERLGFANIISTTTRQRRDNEVNGENYYFTSRSEFKRLLAQGAFVEAIEFNDEYYGVSKKEMDRVMSLDKPAVIICEPVGRNEIEQYACANNIDYFSIWMSNPASVLSERFLRRFLSETNSVEDNDELLLTYSNRLSAMLTTELGWQFNAASNPQSYSLKVWEFNESNVDELLGVIHKLAIMKELPQEEIDAGLVVLQQPEPELNYSAEEIEAGDAVTEE